MLGNRRNQEFGFGCVMFGTAVLLLTLSDLHHLHTSPLMSLMCSSWMVRPTCDAVHLINNVHSPGSP